MMKPKSRVAACLAATLFIQVTASPAVSEDAAQPALSLELNNLSDGKQGCLATFMARNGLEQPLDKVAFEVVLFDKEGRVDRLLLLDFSPLADAKTRVRQFELAGMECTGISRVLVNDAAECSGEGVDPGSCIGRLVTSVRVPVEFGS